jgi:hypothetical protein
VWFLVANTPPSHRPVKPEAPEQHDGLQEPSLHTEHQVAQAETVLPHPTPQMTQFVPPPPETFAQPLKKLAPMRIYTSTAQPEPTPEEEMHGDYAPSFRMVRCKLVNTVDSSSIYTPIIGLVTDDVVWGGKVVIPRCAEVHGVAEIDKARERVSAGGAWTFVWEDGRELVLRGAAMDREDDPEFKRLMVGAAVVDPSVRTWGITDGSSGLRGVVIKSNNAQVLQLFVATFISGIAQATQATIPTVFGGNSLSNNATGAGGLPGYIINPAAQGSSAALDRYAQMVMDSIEKDGLFIRVPAGKLFYVYVTEDILTGKATVGGARRLHQVQSEYLDDRALQEKVTEPRAQRDAKAAQAAQNGTAGIPIDPALTRRLDRASDALEQRSEDLQRRSEQLAQPTLTP